MRAPATDTLEGRTLGELVLREKIGEGGFARVYRAYQATLDREAVVKILHAQLADRPDIVQRFLREARLASKLDHPYAAHVYAFGAEPDGLLWIAMELVRGTPMDRLLEEQGPMSVERFVPLFERICEVVQTAHERGIVHRDLKPSNVMVIARAGRLLPKLLDFGIARVVDDGPNVGTLLETPLPRAREASEQPDSVTRLERPTPTPTSSDEITRDERRAVRSDAIPDPPREAAAVANRSTSERSSRAGAVRSDAIPEPPREAAAVAGSSTSDRPTHAGSVMGSPRYMAPEQWSDARSVEHPADIYALGVMAYEALTGRPPFRAPTSDELMHLHAAAPPPPLGPGLEALDPVIARALAKRPEDRYESAGDLAAAMKLGAGITDPETLPDLDAAIGDGLTTDAPQPLAEAVAALEAARNVDHACAIAWDIVAVATRWLGMLALAARTSVRPGRVAEDRLRALGRGELDDAAWLALATELVRPFAETREAHPLPALVETLLDGAYAAAFERLHALRETLDRRAGQTDEQRRELYADTLAALAELLRPLRWLVDYTVVVTRRGRAEKWRGLRRDPRPALVRRARPLPESEVHLVGADGAPVLRLAPLVRAERPAPNKDEELFLFAGGGPRGARLVAIPRGFELHDAALEAWFRTELLGDAVDAVAATEERAPYRGLAAFTVDDRDFYFGRERDLDVVANRLRVEPFLAIVGPSGAGKTSFVQAGLLTRLPVGWRALIVRPGPAPAKALAAQLAKAGIELDALASLGDALRSAAAREGGTIVLVIDQLEELFAMTQDREKRDAFAEAIASVALSADDPVRVVVTLRDDFLVRAESLPALRHRLASGIKLLASPDADELERVIVEPARRVGYELEGSLAREIANAVVGQPGALPLVSFTAAELWKLRDRHFHRLSRKAYEAIGGVGGALAKHAEATLAELTITEQRRVRDVFRQLVTADGTRRVMPLAELEATIGRAERNVVERLVAARLLVVSEDNDAQDRVEIVHEALLGAWPRLAGWLREDTEGARLRDELRASAKQWESRARPRSLLWRDEPLAELRAWRSRGGELTGREREFADASISAERRTRRWRRGLVALAFLAVAGAAVTMFWLRGQAEDQRALATTRLRQSLEERGRQALLAGQSDEALVFLSEAFAMGADTPAMRFMIARALDPIDGELAMLRGHTGAIREVAVSPDGARIATAGQDGTARLWSASTYAALATLGGHDGTVAIAFHPDGRLATIDARGVVRLWSVDGARHDVLPGAVAAGKPAFDRAGARLVAASPRDGTVRVWDVADRRELAAWTADRAGVIEATLDPEGLRVLTVGGAEAPAIWTAEGGPLFGLGYGAAASARWSPSGDRVIVADEQGSAVYDAETGESVQQNIGGDAISALFDPSGMFVLATGADRRIAKWQATSGDRHLDLVGHTGQINEVLAFDNLVASVGSDGRALLWDGSRQLARYHHGAPIADAALSPDGKRLVTAGLEVAKVWDLSHRERLFRLEAPLDDSASESSLVVEGTRVVRKHGTGVRLWNLDRAEPAFHRVIDDVSVVEIARDGAVVLGKRAGTIATLDPAGNMRSPAIAAHRGAVLAIGLSDDGARAWSLGLPIPDSQLRATDPTTVSVELAIWDRATGREVARRSILTDDELRFVARNHLLARKRATTLAVISPDLQHAAELEHESEVTAVGVSPDGTRIAAAAGDAIVVWTLDGRELARLPHRAPVRAIAWSPRGELVVTGGGDGSLSAWSTANWQRVAHRQLHERSVKAIAFDPRGELLVSADELAIHAWASSDLHHIYTMPGSGMIERLFVDDQRLVTSGYTEVESWRWGSYRDSPAALRTLVSCRVPLALAEGKLVRVEPRCR